MRIFSGLLRNNKYTNIRSDKFEDIIKSNKDVLILDVRSVDEFRSGHIPKAKNIPVQELSSKIQTLDAYKDKEIIVYCASGARSANAAKILYQNGFAKIYNLGGISNYKGKLK
ncbi:MAG: rhodanese-like domain-containing protein [Peptostreptococcaceae bacterium]